MDVSVIIPVYNAAPYIQQAVESSLAQPETTEVVLVEDGSTDDSLAVCQALSAQYPKVKLYQHPDGANRGAGATRNLAIEKSTAPYLAFLDADDYFMPNRFAHARQIFEADASVDGVYEAVGIHFENEAVEQRWDISRGKQRLTTMKKPVSPENLLAALALQRGSIGKFSIIGLVIKRDLIDRTGYFDSHLRLAQDTALMIKMAAMGRLVAGDLVNPVAMRRVHETNRSSVVRPAGEVFQNRMAVADTLLAWGRSHVTPQQQRILEGYRIRIEKERPIRGQTPTRLGRALNLVMVGLRQPRVCLNPSYWWEFLPKS